MHGKVWLVLALVAVVATAGCSGPETTERDLTADDDGKTVVTETGQTITVTLESNPSTGYYWRVTSIDESVVKQDGDSEHTSGDSEPGMTGVSGMTTFRFNTVGAGTSPLKLEYAQGDGAAEESFSVTVKVE